MSLAQEMWDYLKSIGFEDIPNNDDRLGAQGVPDAIHWACTIVRDNLCAFADELTGSYIFLIDETRINLMRGGITTNQLNIHSVADLEAWLRKDYPEFFTTKKPAISNTNASLSNMVRTLKWVDLCAETPFGWLKIKTAGCYLNSDGVEEKLYYFKVVGNYKDNNLYASIKETQQAAEAHYQHVLLSCFDGELKYTNEVDENDIEQLSFNLVEDSDWCKKWIANIGNHSYSIVLIAKVFEVSVNVNGVITRFWDTYIDTLEKAKKLCSNHCRYKTLKGELKCTTY